MGNNPNQEAKITSPESPPKTDGEIPCE